MTRTRRLKEKIIEGLLAASGSLTSVTILLICVFLFKEGAGFFQSPTVEKGYVLCVNASNPVGQLSSMEIKRLFDGELTDWGEAGGVSGHEVRLFRFDEIFSLYTDEELGTDYKLLPQRLADVVAQDPDILAFLPEMYVAKKDHRLRQLSTKTLTASDFLAGEEWLPTATPASLYGLLPLLLGTLLVSIVAILIALPLGLGVAIYLSELTGERMRRILKPAIELLAGIPSVVYGFFGLVVLVPVVQQIFRLSVGETAFAGSLVLAIMALPTVITVAEDAMQSTPRAMREASLALGATRWQTIYKVIVPYASSGISAAVVLGIGRAIGETMAVLMVTGNAAVIPHSLFEPVRTIPATIAAELGEAPAGGTHYQSLFLLGCVLFLLTLAVSITAETIAKQKRQTV